MKVNSDDHLGNEYLNILGWLRVYLKPMVGNIPKLQLQSLKSVTVETHLTRGSSIFLVQSRDERTRTHDFLGVRTRTRSRPSHDFGHGHGFGRAHFRKPRTRTQTRINFGNACPLISGAELFLIIWTIMKTKIV